MNLNVILCSLDLILLTALFRATKGFLEQGNSIYREFLERLSGLLYRKLAMCVTPIASVFLIQ